MLLMTSATSAFTSGGMFTARSAVVQEPSLGNHPPLAAGKSRADLARTTVPLLQAPILPVPPERIDVHHRKAAVLLRAHFDAADDSSVVDELVAVEEGLPAAAPAVPVV